MAEIDIFYEGDLATRVVHLENGAEIATDAPKDNQGLGRFFSPTDLLAVSLGSCALTLMGIAARRLQIDLKGLRARVTKEMQTAPVRRIGRVTIELYCPQRFGEEVTRKLSHAAENCPVTLSLHSDVVQTFIYHWGQP